MYRERRWWRCIIMGRLQSTVQKETSAHDNTLVSTASMLLREEWGGGLSPWQRSHRAKQKSFSRKDISLSSVS